MFSDLAIKVLVVFKQIGFKKKVFELAVFLYDLLLRVTCSGFFFGLYCHNFGINAIYFLCIVLSVDSLTRMLYASGECVA